MAGQEKVRFKERLMTNLTNLGIPLVKNLIGVFKMFFYGANGEKINAFSKIIFLLNVFDSLSACLTIDLRSVFVRQVVLRIDVRCNVCRQI